MGKIEAVQQMQDYINLHIMDSITLADLANVAYYSPWYSYRIFTELTNITPAGYIRKLKLSNSALELRDNKIKILELALKHGYDSVDGYQRAFYKEFGCNPHEYAKNPMPICLFKPYGVKYQKFKEINKMESVKNIFIQVIEKPQRKVIIKRGIKADGYFAYCEEVGCDVWGTLCSIKSISSEPVCLWLPKSLIKPGTSLYVQGVEVSPDYSGIIPDGFDIIDLPQSKYLMFQGEIFPEENFVSAIEEIWDAIKKYNPDVIGYKWDDSNPRIQLEPIGTRGYIELVPIK